MVPLYKKNDVYQSKNYRGIHLTTQLSKVVERLLKTLYVPHLTATLGFGPNQFAYTKKRGARDALAMLTTLWIEALAAGRKVAIYCSDVLGAFDRVKMDRLVAKLHAKKMHPKIVAVLVSYVNGLPALLSVASNQTRWFCVTWSSRGPLSALIFGIPSLKTHE
jgi:hypothetical protein